MAVKDTLMLHLGNVSETANGVSRMFPDLGAGFTRAVLYFNLTAVAGTTTNMAMTLQERNPYISPSFSDNGASVAAWIDVVTFTAVTQATAVPFQERKILDPMYGIDYRLRWVITGTTPSFTFSVSAIMITEEPVP